jgi:hypothetical protein
MQGLLAKCDSVFIRATSSARFSFLAFPTAGVIAAAAACWLLPSIVYREAQVTAYELRYVRDVGNVEFPAGTRTARVSQYSWPTDSAARHRLPYYVPSGLMAGVGLAALAFRRSRSLYRDGHKLYLVDGDLLPINGEPIQGEVLPPIRGIAYRTDEIPREASVSGRSDCLIDEIVR